jgi:hypothetical protein
MTRETFPLHLPDASAAARRLAADLARLSGPPGHVQWLNMLARAAGFANFQHLRSAARTAARPEVPAVPTPDMARVAAARRCFDAEGRLAVWPARTAVQKLCLWPLWARLPRGVSMTEREVSRALDALHGFGDAAILRRTMVGTGLLMRRADGSDYRRVEQAPPPEALALIRTAGRANRG